MGPFYTANIPDEAERKERGYDKSYPKRRRRTEPTKAEKKKYKKMGLVGW
jgi:hypothetical protein